MKHACLFRPLLLNQAVNGMCGLVRAHEERWTKCSCELQCDKSTTIRALLRGHRWRRIVLSRARAQYVHYARLLYTQPQHNTIARADRPTTHRSRNIGRCVQNERTARVFCYIIIGTIRNFRKQLYRFSTIHKTKSAKSSSPLTLFIGIIGKIFILGKVDHGLPWWCIKIQFRTEVNILFIY